MEKGIENITFPTPFTHNGNSATLRRTALYHKLHNVYYCDNHMMIFLFIHKEGLGNFPTSNFAAMTRRRQSAKYGSVATLPMLATKVI
jgi:hypothetical protein